MGWRQFQSLQIISDYYNYSSIAERAFTERFSDIALPFSGQLHRQLLLTGFSLLYHTTVQTLVFVIFKTKVYRRAHSTL